MPVTLIMTYSMASIRSIIRDLPRLFPNFHDKNYSLAGQRFFRKRSWPARLSMIGHGVAILCRLQCNE